MKGLAFLPGLAKDILGTYPASIALAAGGLLGGPYSAVVGLLIGLMIDRARWQAALGRWLSDGKVRDPAEALPGLSAALALAAATAAGVGIGGRPRSLALLLDSGLALATGPRRLLLRPLAATLETLLAEEAAPDAGLAASRVARSGGADIKRLLADALWRLAAESGREEGELSGLIEANLAAAGLSLAEIGAARARAFPGLGRAREILGLGAEDGPAEIRRAWRRLSKRLHPDAGVETGSEAFREAKEAYELLMGRRK